MESNQVATVEPLPITLSDRELMEAIYLQQQQIGVGLNWLIENLTQVFGVVQALSSNGGGVRGLMKMMKEVNNGQSES